MLSAAALFLLSAIGAAVPRSLVEFIAARFVGGIAIGVASMMSPLYIAEIAPARVRGRLVTLNQLAIVVGILCAFMTNWWISGFGPSSWRWMFLVAGLPSLVFLISLLTVPESPRWLMQQSRRADALTALTRFSGRREAEERISAIEEAISEDRAATAVSLLRSPLRRPLGIAIALAMLQQLTGINTILYYGSLIFTEQVKTESASAALWANVIIGVVNLVGTIVALIYLDRIGRKPLRMIASGGMGLALVTLGIAFLLQSPPATLILALILVYVACFAVGLGPGAWLLMSELFPTRVRGRAMSLATISLWVSCLAITLTFLSLVSLLGPSGAFWIYAALCGVTFLFVWKAIPETKGRPLEEIERFWRTEPVQ